MDANKYICDECAHKSQEKLKFVNCECEITKFDYLAALADEPCWCDETDFECNYCEGKLYAYYVVRRSELHLECSLCQSMTRNCCYAGYYLSS